MGVPGGGIIIKMLVVASELTIPVNVLEMITHRQKTSLLPGATHLLSLNSD